MAFLGLEIPADVGRELYSVPVDGEPSGKLHITMLYFGDKVHSSVVAKIVEVASPVMQHTQPFGLVVSQIGYFPPNPEHKAGLYPVIGHVESPYLLALRDRLARVLKRAGVSFSEKFAYKPHVTLAYSESLPRRFRIEPIRWMCSEAALWGGDDEDDRITVRFQLPHEPQYEGRSRILREMLGG